MDSSEYTVINDDLDILWERYPGVQRELTMIIQQRLLTEKDEQISALSKTVALNNGNIKEEAKVKEHYADNNMVNNATGNCQAVTSGYRNHVR